MKKPLNLAAMCLLLFLSSCISCEYDDVVPVCEDMLGGWVLFRTGPDANRNNVADEAELSSVSPDKYTYLLMQTDGTGKIHSEESNSGFDWEMKNDQLVLNTVTGNMKNASYDRDSKEMTIQVRTDTSTIWMVFVKQK